MREAYDVSQANFLEKEVVFVSWVGLARIFKELEATETDLASNPSSGGRSVAKKKAAKKKAAPKKATKKKGAKKKK